MKYFQVFWIRAQPVVGRCSWGYFIISPQLPALDGDRTSPQWYHSMILAGKWSGAFFIPCFFSLTSLGPRTLQTQTIPSPIILQRPADTHWPSLHNNPQQQFAGDHCWMEKACVCVVCPSHFPDWGGETGGMEGEKQRCRNALQYKEQLDQGSIEQDTIWYEILNA